MKSKMATVSGVPIGFRFSSIRGVPTVDFDGEARFDFSFPRIPQFERPSNYAESIPSLPSGRTCRSRLIERSRSDRPIHLQP